MSMDRRLLLGSLVALTPVATAFAASRRSDPKADRAAFQTLAKLTHENTAARKLAQKALAVLVFSRIVKVGFILGGAYGEGAMIRDGRVTGYYNSAAASYGLQAGAQWFGYALFFMSNNALGYFDQSSGFEIGVGPSVVVVDAGMAKKITSSTVTHDIYAIIFGQRGLMAGLAIEGSKITKI